MAMTPQELSAAKKRKANEIEHAKRKRVRLEKKYRPRLDSVPILQDSEKGTWSFTPAYLSVPDTSQDAIPEPGPAIRSYHLYLHRPLTPSSFPKVLVPLDANKNLAELLRAREVLEFPTIYVLDNRPEDLPKKFMLEKKYLAAIKKGPAMNLDMDTNLSDSSEDDLSESDSSSDDDSGVSMEVEEGEIV